MSKEPKGVKGAISDLGKAQLQGIGGRVLAVFVAVAGCLYAMNLTSYGEVMDKVIGVPNAMIGLLLVGLGAFYQRRR